MSDEEVQSVLTEEKLALDPKLVLKLQKEIEKRTHPFANIPPWMSIDELQGIIASIEVSGFRKESPICRAAVGGKNLIVDGRNRELAVMIINKSEEARSQLENRKPALISAMYKDLGELSSVDILKIVSDTNNARRNLSSSQRAGLMVLLEGQAEALSRKRSPDIGSNTIKQEFAVMLASIGGTNRQYVYNAKALVKAGRVDLLEKVVSGELGMKNAVDEMKKPVDSTPDPVDDTGNSQSESDLSSVDELANESEEPAVELVYDSNGLLVTDDDLKQVFKDSSLINAEFDNLKAIRSQLQKITKSPGGEYLKESGYSSYLKNLMQSLADSRPYAICPACGGTGKVSGTKKTCSECGGQKYMVKKVYELYQQKLQSESAAQLPENQGTATEEELDQVPI